ncbi:hypothetical protein HYW75_03570 [Candidatus Pacearchaeota archaeon]|nr:hypothetical protein [Candidatus Pacearchaeota archaeon]
MKMQKQDAVCIIPLPWKGDRYRHKLHSICSRICSFPPSLAKYFILNYSNEGDIVFDPFSGKGTLPLEALLNNRIGWGNDVSPEAYILTKAKVDKIIPKIFFQYLKKLKSQMGFIKSTEDVDPKVKVFYHDSTLKQIIELKELLKNKKSKYAIFTKAIILGILHGSSSYSLSLRCSHSYSMSPGYVKKYAEKNGLEKPIRDVIDCIKNKSLNCLKEGVPSFCGKAFNYDSRNIKIDSDSVDLIVTSPPYFAIQTYAYDNWLRHWFLGYDYKDVNRLLVNTNSEEKYGQFMLDSMKEMYRVLKEGSKCFIVIGDVKKKTSKGDVVINTAEFLIKYVKEAGFTFERIIIDKIPQGRKVFNSALCSAGISTERILVLEK